MGPARLGRGLAAALALTLAAPVAAADTPGADLDGLLDYVARQHPGWSAARLDIEASRAAETVAGAWPDPQLQVELMDVTNEMSGTGTSLLPGEVETTRYRVVQPIRFWGKRDLGREVARAGTAQVRAGERRLAADLRAGVIAAQARRYQALARQRLLEEARELVVGLERLAGDRYALGLVPQQDVIQAQGEITRLDIELLRARQAAREASAALNALLARPAGAPLAAPSALPQIAVPTDLAALRERARSRAPVLELERAAVLGAEGQRALSLRNRYPDFSVGVTSNQPRIGPDTWDVMVEVRIPLQQSARRADETAAQRRLEAARARVAAAEADLDARLDELLAAHVAARETTRLLGATLLPQAQATLAAAEAGYQAGQVNFNTLLAAERQTLQVRLERLDAEVAVALSAAGIEQLIGDVL